MNSRSTIVHKLWVIFLSLWSFPHPIPNARMLLHIWNLKKKAADSDTKERNLVVEENGADTPGTLKMDTWQDRILYIIQSTALCHRTVTNLRKTVVEKKIKWLLVFMTTGAAVLSITSSKLQKKCRLILSTVLATNGVFTQERLKAGPSTKPKLSPAMTCAASLTRLPMSKLERSSDGKELQFWVRTDVSSWRHNNWTSARMHEQCVAIHCVNSLWSGDEVVKA